MPVQKAPRQKATVVIRWDDAKKLAFMQMIAGNPLYHQLYLGKVSRSIGGGAAERSATLFDLTVEFLGPRDPLWLLDMEERGLIEWKGRLGWRKTGDWDRHDDSLPTTTQIKSLNAAYRDCLEAGMRAEWQNWAQAKKASRALHDRIKKRYPLFFEIRALHATSGQASSSASAPPSHASTPPVARPQPKPTKTGSSFKAKAAIPPRHQRSPSFEILPTPPKRSLESEASTTAGPSSYTKRSRVSTGTLNTSRPAPNLILVTPSTVPALDTGYTASTTALYTPHDRSSESFRTDFFDQSPTHDSAGSFARQMSGGDSSKSTNVYRHTMPAGPSARPRVSAAVPLDPRLQRLTHAGLEPRAAARPTPPTFRASVAGPSQLAVNLTAQSGAGSSFAPAALPQGADIPAVKGIDWSYPVYTSELLNSLQRDSRLRALLLPDTQASDGGTISEGWKLERDLFLRMMLQEPGQDWVNKARGWKWVGEKPGKNVVKATVLWTGAEVYNFGDRLRILSDTWSMGRFQSDFGALAGSSQEIDSWVAIMTFLYGPPGIPSPLVDQDPAAPGVDAYPLFSPSPSPRPAQQALPVSPPRPQSPERGAQPQASPTDPPNPSRSSIVISLPTVKQAPAAKIDFEEGECPPEPDNRTRTDFLALCQLAISRGLRLSDLSAERQRKYDKARSDKEEDEIFELGRAEMYAEGVLGLVSLIPLVRRWKTCHRVAYDMRMLPCESMRKLMFDLIQKTGGRRLSMMDIEKWDGRARDQRYEVTLFNDKANPLREQLKTGAGGARILRVGLMEYLEFMSRPFLK